MRGDVDNNICDDITLDPDGIFQKPKTNVLNIMAGKVKTIYQRVFTLLDDVGSQYT